ncbi:TrmH family RNA methyltransferase [Sporanaerobacter sp. PP17-6a]|jgi:TrmH family RNA methyltransferase|uniref:TrmH family RNA methyltransferase n=1 Tax=Sporanaerobacter sp. PP17-6a TaxID=1891289 RepID=UPI0008A00684|nr:RNA methyltransferase [Sporanaerobacter sp. PP17-6a]SCL90682.1 23S rRNA (uridine(2479)-2'-O)-methyltransferase [Sporanaerobacter sp. PP17-6a]
MNHFTDLKSYTLEEKENIFKERYGNKIQFIGKNNRIINIIRALNKNTKPNPEKLGVVEGIWELNMVEKYNIKIKYFLISIEEIYTIEAQELVNSYAESTQKIFAISKKVFEAISEKVNSQGLIAVCYLPIKSLEDIPLKNNSTLVILDGLEIQGNVGTIIRSADATDVDGVIFTNRKIRLNHPKLIRSSMGSFFKVPVIDSNFDETIKWLNKNNFKIILTDTKGNLNFYESDYTGRIAVVMGSEKYGISEEWYSTNHTSVSIPMFGDCDSLNVAIAATVILYEITLKQKKLR